MAATHHASGNLPAAIELLWGERSPAKRGPKPTLTLPTIAQAGIAVADADGLATVTMQRVAEAVGVTKMALYRYVPGKGELVALMIDVGLGEAPRLTEIPGGWRAQLHEWSRQMFETFVRHPWAMGLLTGPRAIGPNELGWLEQALATLTGTALTGAEKLDVAATVAGHTRAIAQQAAAMPDPAPEGVLESAFAALVRGREQQFPALVAALASAVTNGGTDKALTFGLDRILDGVALLIQSRT